MFRLVICLMCFVLITLVGKTMAQNLLNGPESVVFDSLHNRYLVSNPLDQSIVQIDSNGTQSLRLYGQYSLETRTQEKSACSERSF